MGAGDTPLGYGAPTQGSENTGDSTGDIGDYTDYGSQVDSGDTPPFTDIGAGDQFSYTRAPVFLCTTPTTPRPVSVEYIVMSTNSNYFIDLKNMPCVDCRVQNYTVTNIQTKKITYCNLSQESSQSSWTGTSCIVIGSRNDPDRTMQATQKRCSY